VTTALAAQVREVHNLHDHAGPSSEVLRTLASTSVRVVLLPREASLEPRVVDGVNQVLAQVGVHSRSALLLRTWLLGDVLEFRVSTVFNNVIWRSLKLTRRFFTIR
jgi:hypothetical protein